MSKTISWELDDNLKIIIESEITRALNRRCTPKECSKIAQIREGRDAKVVDLTCDSDGVLTAHVRLPSWLGIITQQDIAETMPPKSQEG